MQLTRRDAKARKPTNLILTCGGGTTYRVFVTDIRMPSPRHENAFALENSLRRPRQRQKISWFGTQSEAMS